MNTIDTATITFRKTRDGEWVAFGPRDIIEAHVVSGRDLGDAIGLGEDFDGQPIEITKRNGEAVYKWVRHVGRGFDVDGVEHAYGYLYTDRDLVDLANNAINR